MNLIPQTEPTQPTEAERVAKYILETIEAEHKRRVKDRSDAWNMVWANPNAEACDIIAAMGTSAGRVFESSAEDARSLMTLAAIWGHDPETFVSDSEVTPPLPCLPQEDGSIIVQVPEPVEEPPVEPES